MSEYLEQFNELVDTHTFKGQQWFGKRQQLVEKYSWAVPNRDALVYLSEFEELIEIGAGNGYWAKRIEDHGGTVEAYDIEVPNETYHEVHEKNILTPHGGGVHNKPVLMVWPPCHTNMAEQVVEEAPSHILYVGEPRGGCTATDGFFDRLEQEYGLVAKIDIPSYECVNDDLFHYVRKI